MQPSPDESLIADSGSSAARDLRAWEKDHQKRICVYKVPASTTPSNLKGSNNFENTSELILRDHTAKLLAKKYYDITAAHNDRQWDRSKEPWCSTASNFSFEVAYGDRQVVDLDEYLELGKRMFADPTLKVEVYDVTIQVDLMSGIAEVFANQALVSPQVTRKSVCVVELRQINGEWLVVNGRNIKGEVGV